MKFLLRVCVVCLTLLLTACIFDSPSSPSEAPANVTITAGEGLVQLDWDVEPGLVYWVFYKQGTSAGLDEYENILTNVAPPVLVQGLVNGTQYAFSVTASRDGSKVGPFSPVVTATPRILDSSIPWEEGPLTDNTKNLLSIAFGNNTYVTVGSAGSVFVGPYNYSSPGGVTAWTTPASLPALTADLTSVMFDSVSFIVLGYDGSITISTDSMTWTAAMPIIPLVGVPAMNAITVGAGAYVAVGESGTIYTNRSPGITAAWDPQVSGVIEHLYGVSYLNGLFIAVGANGTLLTSIDGITWDKQVSNAGTNTLRQVAYGAGSYVVVGDNGTVVTSTDAINWSGQAAPTGLHMRAITFASDNQFIAVGNSGLLAYSATGNDGSWDVTNAGVGNNLNSIAPGLVIPIAVGDAGVNVSGK